MTSFLVLNIIYEKKTIMFRFLKEKKFCLKTWPFFVMIKPQKPKNKSKKYERKKRNQMGIPG